MFAAVDQGAAEGTAEGTAEELRDSRERMTCSVQVQSGLYLPSVFHSIVPRCVKVCRNAKYGVRMSINLHYEELDNCNNDILLARRIGPREYNVLGTHTPGTYPSFQFFFERYDDLCAFVDKDVLYIVTLCDSSLLAEHLADDVFRACRQCHRVVINARKIRFPLDHTTFDRNTTCGVCLDGVRVNSRSALQLDCGHVLHDACLPPISSARDFISVPGPYVCRTVSCPMCRFKSIFVVVEADAVKYRHAEQRRIQELFAEFLNVARFD